MVVRKRINTLIDDTIKKYQVSKPIRKEKIIRELSRINGYKIIALNEEFVDIYV